MDRPLYHQRAQSFAGGPPRAGQNLSSKPEEDPEGTGSRRLSANHSCAKQPSCLEGLCISPPWPHAHLPGLPSMHADDFLVGMKCLGEVTAGFLQHAWLVCMQSRGAGSRTTLGWWRKRIGEEYNPLSSLLQWDSSAHMFYPVFRKRPEAVSLRVCSVNLLIHALSMGCRPCLWGRTESDTTEAT